MGRHSRQQQRRLPHLLQLHVLHALPAAAVTPDVLAAAAPPAAIYGCVSGEVSMAAGRHAQTG